MNPEKEQLLNSYDIVAQIRDSLIEAKGIEGAFKDIIFFLIKWLNTDWA